MNRDRIDPTIINLYSSTIISIFSIRVNTVSHHLGVDIYPQIMDIYSHLSDVMSVK